MSNPIRQAISEVIKAQGHITVDHFMELCLFHPIYGYYNKSGQFGRTGDFITAPEVSQLFGETIAIWCLSRWQDMGCPKSFNLIELGPGRGTMMADILRVATKFPEFLSAAQVILVEKGESLKRVQKDTLCNHKFTHINDIEELEDKSLPCIIVANEFFDAFPVKQFVCENSTWFEKVITEKQDILVWEKQAIDFTPKTEEASPASEVYFRKICELLLATGGYFLFIDYGYSDGQGHSLQALNKHEYSQILENLGESDLSAHVNFKRLLEIARDMGLETSEAITQGQFLSENGMIGRAKNLMDKNPERQNQIETEALRLIHPQQMGTLFKTAIVHGKK